MPHPLTDATLQLRPGVRVSRRGDGQLQVGLHPDERTVLPDSGEVRALLRDLAHGVRPTRVPDRLVAVLDTLRERGLLATPGASTTPSGPPGPPGPPTRPPGPTVRVTATDAVRATAVRMLAAAGMQVAGRRARPDVLLHVTSGAEPRREVLDEWVREDRPHLTLTTLAGRSRLGPFVVPGLTACLRCVDEHHTDRDPRHPLVLEQHHATDPRDTIRPEDLQLALAWAVRDLTGWAEGRRPTTWSSTVELAGGDPVVRVWRRHPRCGCAWGDLLAG